MTIYALSTGPGVSGIAIIRISGPETKYVIQQLTQKPIPEPLIAWTKMDKNQKRLEFLFVSLFLVIILNGSRQVIIPILEKIILLLDSIMTKQLMHLFHRNLLTVGN